MILSNLTVFVNILLLINWWLTMFVALITVAAFVKFAVIGLALPERRVEGSVIVTGAVICAVTLVTDLVLFEIDNFRVVVGLVGVACIGFLSFAAFVKLIWWLFTRCFPKISDTWKAGAIVAVLLAGLVSVSGRILSETTITAQCAVTSMSELFGDGTYYVEVLAHGQSGGCNEYDPPWTCWTWFRGSDAAIKACLKGQGLEEVPKAINGLSNEYMLNFAPFWWPQPAFLRSYTCYVSPSEITGGDWDNIEVLYVNWTTGDVYAYSSDD